MQMVDRKVQVSFFVIFNSISLLLSLLCKYKLFINGRLNRRVNSTVCQYGHIGPPGSRKPVFGTPFLYARHLNSRISFLFNVNLLLFIVRYAIIVFIQCKFATIYSKVCNNSQ